MDEAGIDACLFTSYYNFCYFFGFLYCKFGRRYGAVLTRDGVTTVSAAIDGGQALAAVGRRQSHLIPICAATAISPH